MDEQSDKDLNESGENSDFTLLDHEYTIEY